MYAKVFDSIYSGSLRGRAHEQLVFIYLLVNSWQTKGICDIHPRRICDDVGLTMAEVSDAIDYLQRPDPESRSPKLSGRRIELLDEHRSWGWRIVNWDKYNSIQRTMERKEYQANYFQEVIKPKRHETQHHSTHTQHRSTKVNESTEERRVEEKKGEEKKTKDTVPATRSRFVPPSLEEVKAYCLERRNRINPEQYLDWYESNGWRVGKNPMKSWKAAVRTWERNGYAVNGAAPPPQPAPARGPSYLDKTKKWREEWEREQAKG